MTIGIASDRRGSPFVAEGVVEPPLVLEAVIGLEGEVGVGAGAATAPARAS